MKELTKRMGDYELIGFEATHKNEERDLLLNKPFFSHKQAGVDGYIYRFFKNKKDYLLSKKQEGALKK